MKLERLEPLSSVTIGEILNLIPLMKMPVREAMPAIEQFRNRHELTFQDAKTACAIIEELGLVEYISLRVGE